MQTTKLKGILANASVIPGALAGPMARTTLIAALAVGALTVSAVPGFGADTSTLSASVTMPAPCIEVTLEDLADPATHLIEDSNSKFSTTSGLHTNTLSATDGTTTTVHVNIHNCGENAQAFSVVGTDPASTTSTASWTLTSLVSCDGTSESLNKTRVGIDVWGGVADLVGSVNLSTTAAPLPGGESVASGETVGELAQHWLQLPCAGSDGVGETMTFDVTYIAEIAS